MYKSQSIYLAYAQAFCVLAAILSYSKWFKLITCMTFLLLTWLAFFGNFLREESEAYSRYLIKHFKAAWESSTGIADTCR